MKLFPIHSWVTGTVLQTAYITTWVKAQHLLYRIKNSRTYTVSRRGSCTQKLTTSASDCLSSNTWDLLTLHSFLFFLAILLSSSERDNTEALRSLGRDNKELHIIRSREEMRYDKQWSWCEQIQKICGWNKQWIQTGVKLNRKQERMRGLTLGMTCRKVRPRMRSCWTGSRRRWRGLR